MLVVFVGFVEFFFLNVILLFYLSCTLPTTDWFTVPVAAAVVLDFSFNTWTPSLYNSKWLDLTLEFWLWRATSSRMQVFCLIGFLNHFSHFLRERKKGKAERSKQVTREIKGAGILRCWVSSCVLLSHLMESVVASLYFFLLHNFPRPDKNSW